MADPENTPPSPLEPRLTLELSPAPVQQLSQESPSSPVPPRESAARFAGWETIGEQNDFYDLRDCLHPGYRLASDKLKSRKEDDVVIFDYSLDPGSRSRVDGNPLFEQGSPPSGHFRSDNDRFFRVSRAQLIGSKEFGQITKEPRLTLSRGPRLGVIDFAQCYDTSRKSSTFQIQLRLGRHIQKEFWHCPDVGVLGLVFHPGNKIQLGAESESIGLLDFKRLGAHVPGGKPGKLGGDKTEIGEVLVHQARYMIFDNSEVIPEDTMAIFRSKEDSAKSKVPLHFLQERIGAFHAMIHMAANNTDLETWILETVHPNDEGAQRKRNRTAVQKLLTSLDTLSADLFAVISMAERQIAILDDLHGVLLASYRTKARNHDERSSLRQNPSHKNVALALTLAENPEQMWQNTSDSIDEVVQKRKSFIKRAERLLENMEIRRKILFGFLKSGHAEAATEAMKLIERTIRESQATLAEQDKALLGFTFITIVFLPLNFFTSYFGMDSIKDSDMLPLSIRDFWLIAGPISTAVILLSLLLITWTRPTMAEFRTLFRKELSQSPKGKTDDIENQGSSVLNSQEQTLNGSTNTSGSLHPLGGGGATPAGGSSIAPSQKSADPDSPSEPMA
ncbi:hypothetical protein C7212DRAFT_360614 [Tuber magnatum]|uniref:Cora-domain-containing protein n=1 Tax=Tuber magnatum TaxID=42249 RepID=A0A317SX73_9PEZI|nr:hypothetical protein C7212DRAFT_360614 [Tuber magnatum]